MIKCRKCKQIKKEEDFNFSNKHENIRRHDCRECQKKYTAAYNAVPANRERHREHGRNHRKDWHGYKRGEEVYHIHLTDTQWGGEQRLRVARMAMLHKKNLRNGTEVPLCVS